MNDRLFDGPTERWRSVAKVATAGAVALLLIGLAVAHAVREERSALPAEADAPIVLPALVRYELPGMAIATPVARLGASRLESASLATFLQPRATGVIVEWRDGTLRDAQLPQPGDAVDMLLRDPRRIDATRAEARGAARAIELALDGRLHGIATYVECRRRVVLVLAWHEDPRPYADQIVRGLRCAPLPGV